MSKSKMDIIDDIDQFMRKHGGTSKEWFVASSINPKVDLFRYHGFRKGDKGLMRTAMSELQAAEVAEFFMDQGAKGNDEVITGATYVYAYKRTAHTTP